MLNRSLHLARFSRISDILVVNRKEDQCNAVDFEVHNYRVSYISAEKFINCNMVVETGLHIYEVNCDEKQGGTKFI